jgi:hypothetical protein
MVLTLYPYWHEGCWVFDDPAKNLTKEAFVLGISEMISRVLAIKGIPRPEVGFALSFAAEPFAGHDVVVDWQRPGDGPDEERRGNWYAGDVAGAWMEGWLCPALFEYFDEAPPRIFVGCEPLPEGVNPRWENPSREAMRYVGPEGPGVR